MSHLVLMMFYTCRGQSSRELSFIIVAMMKLSLLSAPAVEAGMLHCRDVMVSCSQTRHTFLCLQLLATR